MRGVIAFFVFVVTFSYSVPASARVYPWVWMGKDDIQVTDHPRVEAEIRLEMIRRAQVSLDIVTFDQRADQGVGMPLMQAVEEAAKRGVKIRFATTWLAPILKDPWYQAANFMTTLAKKYPNIEYVTVGGAPMRKRGWGYIDGIHEKLLIVDKKWVLVTGRGHADEYLTWLDTAFIFRGAMVDQSVKAYGRLWKAICREQGIECQTSEPTLAQSNSNESQIESESFHKEPQLPMSEEEREELKALSHWLDEPPSEKKEYKGRLLHHDLLDQLGKYDMGLPGYSYDERAGLVRDPVLKEAIRLLSKAKDFQLSILATIFDPRLKEAILSALKRGVNVELLTNGSESHTAAEPIPFAIGWYASLPGLDEVLLAGAKGYELKHQGGDTARFLHRKLAIFDDTVIFGSHNLTISSTLTQDEVSFEIQSADFAQRMTELSKHSIQINSEALNTESIHLERLATPYRQWFSSFLDKIYLE
jgi:putative cardiolipin synthase